jgi:hypothetical protein
MESDQIFVRRAGILPNSIILHGVFVAKKTRQRAFDDNAMKLLIEINSMLGTFSQLDGLNLSMIVRAGINPLLQPSDFRRYFNFGGCIPKRMI